MMNWFVQQAFLKTEVGLEFTLIQFRKKSFEEQYKKYDWIEIDLVKNTSDFRKESFRPVSYDTEIKIIDHLDTKSNWLLRKEIVFKNKVYTDIDELIAEAKNREIMTSLAVFKPTEIVDFTIEQVEREWDKKKLEKLKQDRSSNLFAQEDEDLFEVVRKLPYKFSYVVKYSPKTGQSNKVKKWLQFVTIKRQDYVKKTEDIQCEAKGENRTGSASRKIAQG